LGGELAHDFVAAVGDAAARVFGTPKPPPSALEQLVNQGDRDDAVTPDADHIADEWAAMNKKEFGKPKEPTPDPVVLPYHDAADAEKVTMRSVSSASSLVTQDAQEAKPINIGKMLHDMEGLSEQSQPPAEEAMPVELVAVVEPTTTIEPAANIIDDWTKKLESLHTTPRTHKLQGLIQAMSSAGRGFVTQAAQPEQQTEAPPNPERIVEQWTNKLESKYGTPAPKDPYPSMMAKIMLAQIDPKNDGLAALDAQSEVARPAPEASAAPQVGSALAEQSHASFVAQLYATPKPNAEDKPHVEHSVSVESASIDPAKTLSGTSTQASPAPSLLEQVENALGIHPHGAAAPSAFTEVAESEDDGAPNTAKTEPVRSTKELADPWQSPFWRTSFAQQATAEMRVAERSASSAVTWSEAAITQVQRAAMSTPLRAILWVLLSGVAIFLTSIWRMHVNTREAAVVKIQALYRGCKFRDRLFADVMSPDADYEGAGLGEITPDATQ
jgi:hypothetical protein